MHRRRSWDTGASVAVLARTEHRRVELEPHRTNGVEFAEPLGRGLVQIQAVAPGKVVHMLSVARAADQHVDHGDVDEAASTATPSTASLMRWRKLTTTADSSGDMSMTAASMRSCMFPSVSRTSA